MRYISEDEILKRLPDEWCIRADIISDKIKQSPEQEWHDIITDNATIWSDIKTYLEECSFGKCWYCESKQDRSDNSVDHFRPKNRVVECKGHSGYGWLAFNWRNYRYSCTYCNSRRKEVRAKKTGGKHDHFPLIDESKRARLPSDNLDEEEPYLLDPTKRADPGLLWFDQNGKTVPRHTMEKYGRFFKRAETSIYLYHLNYSKTRERRKILYYDR